jgi:hypothetical protein
VLVMVQFTRATVEKRLARPPTGTGEVLFASGGKDEEEEPGTGVIVTFE